MLGDTDGDEERALDRLSTRYRVALDCRLIIRLKRGPLGLKRRCEIEATIVDLSINGGGMVTDEPIKGLVPGQRATLVIDGHEGLVAVRRDYSIVDEPHVGIEFIELSAELEATIFDEIGESRGNEQLENYWTQAE